MTEILYVSEAPFFGGAERYLLSLLQGLNRDEFVPTVAVAPGAPPRLVSDLENLDIPVHVLAPIRGKADVAGLFRQRAYFRNVRPHIVHFNLSNPLHGQYSMLAARAAHRIATMHLPPRTTTPTRRGRFLERLTICNLDVLIAVSESSRQRMIAHFGINPNRTERIYNGIDPEQFDREAAHPATGLFPGNGPIIGTVGRLADQKGHTYLLQAAAQILHKRPDARFVIVGDGPLREDLTRQCAALGIAERVYFAGERADVPALLSSFTTFVLPSLYESFPFVLLEAMAAGIPIVATDVDGVPEAVEEGRTAYLVPPRAPDALAGAILSLLEDPEHAKKMGALGRRRLETDFTLNTMQRRTEQAYRQCLRRDR